MTDHPERYTSFGEGFEDREDLSPSARKALEEYMELAGKIIKARREDGGIDWESSSRDGDNSLAALDAHPDFNPLFVEMLFLEETEVSARLPHDMVLYRDEAGEIRITDEGLERQKLLFLDALERAKKDLAKPPESLRDKDMGSFIAFLTYAPFRQAPVFHPRAESIFTEKQLETAREVDRLHQEFFNEHWEEIRGEKKTSASPGGRPRSLVFDNWHSSWNLDGEIPPEEPEPPLPSAPTIRDSFNGVRFASFDTIREAVRAMWITSLWKRIPKGWTYYDAPPLKKKELTFLLGESRGGEVRALPGEEVLPILKTLGMETGLLHIQFAAWICGADNPCESRVNSNANDLIKMLQIDTRRKKDPLTGKNRRLKRVEQLQELEGYLKALRSIHVIFSATGKDGRVWKTKNPEPLWDILILETSQEYLKDAGGTSFLSDRGEAVDFDIRVRAGGWALGEIKLGEKYSYIAKSVRDFSPYQDWAIKLAVYASFFPNNHRFKLRTLLEQILDPEEITGMEDPSGDKRKRNDTANKLESTLAAMEERGWSVERSPEYIAAMGNGEGRRSRNFFPRLLESRLELTPPPVSGQKSLPKEKKAPGDGTAFSGRAFREQREKMGLSQKEAARELGRSQGMIALIESGTRRLSPEDSKTWEKLRKRHYSGSRTSPDKKAAKTCKD